MIQLFIVEDNLHLQQALADGFNARDGFRVCGFSMSGEDALDACLKEPPQAILMDVHLTGQMNGIQAAIAIRREFPRMPVIFYSIQDDESYYREFRQSGILSHYAYVRKSNYLLPAQLAPLIENAVSGRSFIDPEIEQRVQEVREKDRQSPLAVLEPNERAVVSLLARGYTNEQIADALGFRDKRTVSRTNGQIYAAWGLDATATDEKVARSRAILIAISGRMLEWGADGQPFYRNERGEPIRWEINER